MNKEFAIDKLIEYSDKCVNMYELCQKLGIKSIGGEDYKEVKNLSKELGIELKFSYQRREHKKTSPQKNIEEILVENSTYKNATRLKERLIREGLKENKCERCGLTSWLGNEISLQIHHVNGIHNDNRLDNIEILCPNCHSQTDTYCGKNANREKPTKYLPNKISNEAKNKTFEETHPSKQDLLNSFYELKSFLAVGKRYGVTDNAIRKWCDHYGIPRKRKDIIAYLNSILQDNN